MTNWTKEDAEALRYAAAGLSEYEPSPDGKLGTEHPTSGTLLVRRAADEIERLQARVAELELEVSATMQASHRRDAERMELCGNMATMRRRIAALEAERAEVAKELRELSEPTGVRTHDALMTLREEVRALAYRLERKGEP